MRGEGDAWTNESPSRILQDFVPFGAAAPPQKRMKKNLAKYMSKGEKADAFKK